MDSNIVKNIKRVVVLMMENRSFDHLFGDFSGVNGITSGLYNLSNPNIENSTTYYPYKVNVTAQPKPTSPATASFDPGHAFSAMMPDIFGPGVRGYTSGTGGPFSATGTYSPPPKYGPNYMCGFVPTNPETEVIGNGTTVATVMSYFEHLPAGDPGRLNVLHTLAENYVLCDNWFCDTPAMTMPNRNFVHLATNLGFNDFNPYSYVAPGDPEGGEAGNLYDAKTIYELLDNVLYSRIDPNPRVRVRPNWAMYGFPSDEYDSAVFSYTSPAFSGSPPANFVNANRSIFDFPIDVLTGNLPFYTFIMPSLLFGSVWADGNSMHPNGDVRLGENLIASVYNVLRNNPIWNETLLIVTFDENGGTYDHVAPPGIVSTFPGAPPPIHVTPPDGIDYSQWFTQQIPGQDNQFALYYSFAPSVGSGTYTKGGTWKAVVNHIDINGTITGATGNGVSPIVVTSSPPLPQDAAQVTISGVQGNIAANGTWVTQQITGQSNQFGLYYSLVPSVGDGAGTYTSGGTWTNGVTSGTIAGATNTNPIVITTSSLPLPPDGSPVSISGVKGNTAANAPILFDYTMLGPRIPALLISPWVRHTICNDQLQNTSILRFVEDLAVAQSTHPNQPPQFLTQRDASAPSFANSDVWTKSARTDCPESIALYPGFPNWGTELTDPHGASPGAGPYIPPNPPDGQGSTYDPDGFVAESSAAYQFAKEYCAYYPGHPDSGRPLSRKFRSLRDLRDYMTERRRAARTHYHADKRMKQASA